MYHWLAFVWVRYVLWLLLGIVLGYLWPGGGEAAMYLCLLAGMLYVLLLVSLRKNLGSHQLTWGTAAFIFLALLGYWRTQEAQQPPQFPPAEGAYWWALAREQAVETPNSYRFQASIAAADAPETSVAAMVYLPKENSREIPEAGDGLLLKGTIQFVPAPFNPHEFDYRHYLATQSIHFQFFARSHLKGVRPPLSVSPWEALAFKSRRYLKEVVKHFVADEEASAVVAAMVLGQRSDLNRSLRQAYADAGVMHVLAVSGLHVGLVFGVFLLLLRYMQGGFWQRLTWLVVVLVLLWSYAWLTGLSPSALRATWMFSIVALGKLDVRKGNIYNSIALSAFILLLWNPLLLLQVGFQLSYAAVIGIVYLQPRIRNWFTPKAGWLRWVWDLLSVTLAAQLATFPLGLYYFHQFPTYFFVGNLLAIPLATAILYTTLLLLVFHLVPWLNELLAWVVSGLTQLLNGWVQLTEQLPGSRLVGTITATDLLLFYACMLALLLLLRYRSFGWALASMGLLLLLGGSGLHRTHALRTQQQLTIYQIPGHSLLHFIHGQQEVLLPLGDLPKPQQLSYHVEPSRIQAGFGTPLEQASLPADFSIHSYQSPGLQYLLWQGVSIAVVEGKGPIPQLPAPLPAQVVLLRNNPRISLPELTKLFRFQHLVMDASNSQRYRQRARQAADSLKLPLHITSESGAFLLHPKGGRRN